MARRRTFLPPPRPIEGAGFALALSASHAVNLDALCRQFEVLAQDLPHRLSKLPAVLLSGLSLREASDLSRRLGEGGVTVTILPAEGCGSYPQLDLKLKPGGAS